MEEKKDKINKIENKIKELEIQKKELKKKIANEKKEKDKQRRENIGREVEKICGEVDLDKFREWLSLNNDNLISYLEKMDES